MRRLDRYIIREILGPLTLGFLVFTFILLLQALFKFAELIISRGVPVETVGRLLAYSLPHIVVMTIPMALLFGILIAIGRLSADSELIALRAAGVSLFSLYRPILLLSAVLAAFNAYLMIEVLPRGNTALERLQAQIVSGGLTEEIEPRTFYPGSQDRLLYVFEKAPEENRWKGAFLAKARPFGDDEVIIAEWGQAIADGDSSAITLFFENAYSHRVNLLEPERYDVALNRRVSMTLETPARSRSAISSGRQMRSLHLRELRAKAAETSLQPQLRNLARVEIHKKFAIPAACLVFGLLALPLGITRSRGGHSSGFAVSIFIILIYYVLLHGGEQYAASGDLPPVLAVWFSNLVMVAAGFYLLVQRNRDRSLLLARLEPWVQGTLWQRLERLKGKKAARRARRRAALEARRTRADLVLRLPRLQLRFPNRLDRYVLNAFCRMLVLAMSAGLVIYVVADFTGKADEILKHGVSNQVVIDYYLYKSFAIVYEIAPIIVLVATLVAFGLLSRNNELVAIKAAGVSLYRLAVPVVLAAALFSGLAGVMQSEVLAASNSRVAELEAEILDRPVRPGIRRADRQWLADRGNVLYNYLSYDPDRRLLYRLQVFRFDRNHRLTDRLMVERATWAGDGWWLLENGWAWSFDGNRLVDRRIIDRPVKHRLSLSPDLLAGEERLPDEMTYAELRDYIAELAASGQRVPRLELALHNKIAYPAISLVMALVALPFSFRLGRRGALYGIGLSLILGIVFMAVLAAFTALGETGVLPPLIAVWSPGAIFSVFSLYLFLGIRT